MPTIRGVEVFKEGNHLEHEFGSLSLSSMAVGFIHLQPEVPVVIGHGGPEVGKVTAVRGEGDRLIADIEVDDDAYERIKSNELHAVSVGIRFDCGHTIRELALLGQGEVAYCQGLRALREALEPHPGP